MTNGGGYSKLWKCCCASTGPCSGQFHTIQNLKMKLGERCRLLKGGLEPLNMMAPEFFDPVATTIGPNSLITDRGRYAPLQFGNMRFRCNSHRIAVRTSRADPAYEEKCLVAIAEFDTGRRWSAGLHVFNDHGRIVHRIDLPHADDELVLAAAGGTAQTWHGALAFLEQDNAEPESNVISLAPYIAARDKWDRFSLEDHLDDIIVDGGRSRLKRLRRLGLENAWPVSRAVLPSMFGHLEHQRVDFTRIVPQPTLLQANRGPLDGVRLRQNLALLYCKDSIMALDLSSVAECWIVAYGSDGHRLPALELYDGNDMCQALFLVDRSAPVASLASWGDLLGSLPRR